MISLTKYSDFGCYKQYYCTVPNLEKMYIPKRVTERVTKEWIVSEFLKIALRLLSLKIFIIYKVLTMMQQESSAEESGSDSDKEVNANASNNSSSQSGSGSDR